MGVEGLYKFINKNCNDVYETININEMHGKAYIIDGIQHIYSQLIYFRTNNKEILTSDGKNITHLHGLINSLSYYLKNNIIPIFIFDGKSPEIKKNKIEQRRIKLKENLLKLKELNEKQDNLNEIYNTNIQIENDTANIIYVTPPDNFFLKNHINKINELQQEYKRIYKKSIILKSYFIDDWIQILELLGLPVIRAKEEADPVCSYILNNNNNISGIISDDSDMLIFGSKLLMKKSLNKNYTVIQLDNLLNKINLKLKKDLNIQDNFEYDNLIDFAILLGTDYSHFKLNYHHIDSYDLLKYYINCNRDISKIISNEQIELFNLIKNYYKNDNINIEENYTEYLEKPIWNKPNLIELKKMLLNLNVSENYINKFNYLINNLYIIYNNNNNKFNKSYY